MVVTRIVKAKQSDIKDAPYFDSRKHIRKEELKEAIDNFSDLKSLHEENIFNVIFSKDFFNADLRIVARYFNELITGKRLKAAEELLHKEEMLLVAAQRMYALTGEQKDSVSGVVKNEKIANATSAKNTQALKIAAAMALTYGSDAALKKKIMVDLENKYPELVDDIKSLVKKAKARINQDEFKRATAGMKFGKGLREPVRKNVVADNGVKKSR